MSKLPHLTRLVLVGLGSLLVAHASQGQAPETSLPGGDWAALLRKVPEGLQKLSLAYKLETSMQNGTKTVPVLEVGELAWNVQNDHFFNRAIQCRNNDEKDPKHWVITAWDGTDAFFWSRYIDPSQPGNRMIGAEPEDSGTIVRQARSAKSALVAYKEALGLMDYGMQEAVLKAPKVTVRPGTHPELPGGKIFRLEGPGGAMEIHVPTGWVVLREYNGADGKRFLKTQLGGFRKIPSTALYFPTSIVRTTTGEKGEEGTMTLHINPSSLKINDAVTFPTIDPPPGTSIQDQLAGTYKTVTDDDAASALEARLRFILKQAEKQLSPENEKPKK